MAVLVVVVMIMVMIIVVVMVMMMAVPMIVIMTMLVALRLAIHHLAIAGLNARLAFSASANSAHQSTSSSLIRNSSPPVTCT